MVMRRIFTICLLILAANAVADERAVLEENWQRWEGFVKTQRYWVHGDGTVTDPVTELMWQRCSVGQQWDGNGCRGEALAMDWQMARAQRSDWAGYSDWRLPTIDELKTLVWCSSGQPANYPNGGGCEGSYLRPTIQPQVFPSTPPTFFWSASPYAGHSGYAWSVHFNYGDGSYGYRYYGHRVRLVRGGQ
jgi:hypothetical protein